MRYFILLPALTLALACHKTTATDTPIPPATFSFSANGTLYQMNGSRTTSSFGSNFLRMIGGGCIATDTTFALQAIDSVGDSLFLGTEPITSLVVGTYQDSLTFVRSTCSNGDGPAALKNITSSDFDIITPADHSTIVVTSIHDGLASGTFTAHLTIFQSSPDSSITIMDGQFTNVPIVDQ